MEMAPMAQVNAMNGLGGARRCRQGALPGGAVRRLASAALLVALAVIGPPASAIAAWAQAIAPPPDHGQPRGSAAAHDVEAEGDAAAVTLGGDPVFWITTGLGLYTPALRAERITRRLEEAVRDSSIQDPTVTVTDVEDSSELRVGPRVLMVVTERDARSFGVARSLLAQQVAREFETAIRNERKLYAPKTLLRSASYGLLATLVLMAGLWLIGRLKRALLALIGRRRALRAEMVRVKGVELFSADRLSATIARAVTAAHVVLVLLTVNLYLSLVLGLFPWTRAVSSTMLGSVVSPVRAAARGFVGYLPNLMFVLVISALVYFAIRLVGAFFQQLREGRVVFANFPAEWADPTNKIARVMLVAFGVVVVFPYLPASSSPAFAGVSVFMGILISLASSSSLSNMIAGLVLTYTGAFRLGDRVQIGDNFGDIVEMSLLVTRIRTIKNEEVTIPNGLVLGTSVTNYSRAARTHGIILHTSVTIGYDAPWRTVHQLLLDAAAATPGLLGEPRPFVWQTALNDFYVTYEINAYTDVPAQMAGIYAALHANIQDAFCRGGVEIMSPHFTALRDGNGVTIPAPFRPAGYRPPAFRVERATPDPEVPRSSADAPGSDSSR